MLCALCLRDPDSRPILEPDVVAEAITIANGHAVCEVHFRRLVDWQTEVHGPLSIEALLRVMHDPGPIPAPPWADAAPRP